MIRKKTLGQMPVYSVVGLVLVDSVELRSRFEPSPQRCLTQLESILPALVQRLSLALRNELDEAVRRLSSTPNEMEDFVEYMQFVQTIRTRQDGIQGQFDKVVAMDELMEAYDVPVKPEDRAFFKTLNPTLQTLRASVEISEDEMETKVTDFSARLDGQISKLRGGIMEVKHEAQHDLVLDVSSAVQDVLGFIGALENRIDQCKEEAARFRRYQELFRVQPATFDDLDEVAADIKLKSSLWNGLESWAELLRKWQYAAFDSIDSDDMAMQVKKYLRLCSVVERSLPENDVVKKLHGQVKEFDVLLPIILDLHNPALRARHWDEITAALGRPRQRLVRDEKFTLGSLLEMDVMSCRGQIQEISVAATNEAELDEMLKKLDGVWAALEFDVQPFKDSKDQLILTQVDEVQEQLAESMVTICTIRGSRFMGPVKSLVDEWEENLGLFSRALDAWVQCQRSWIYLESIFSAPDIQRQLPLEAKTFAAVEKNWRNLMLHARDAPNAFNLCCSRDNLATLEFANEQMEIVSAALRNYLEAKRLAFPRFYFLSDEELFEILSRTRNPHAVQPHLLKCFDNIAQLEFRDDSIEIVAMISSEGERVELGRNLKARGSVEQWLSAVESSMVLALRRHMKAGIMSYARTAREGWAMSHPTQVVLVASQIWWAKQVNEALNSEDPAAVLGAIHEQSVKQLNALTAVVRGNLTRLQLETIKALLTLDVHSRDVAEGLITQGIASSGDFEWKRQMRYDWDVTSEVVVVRQATAEFSYRYEFLGGSGRLVITPLTDRCYITLMTAMQMQLGGAPAGPAGTGKTETVKDLAKALANQCFVFNCSDGLEYQMMGRFFSGLCQAGAWACFDEFNRIDIEVLSVVAQQIASIRSAMKRNVTRFVFEGKTVAVNPRCAVFITMNPGYAGRTELPSNLKSLFRPVSMTVADYALIAEILLFSQGFRGALPLSRKIVNLYKLCDEQLSTQSHYDFGMRPLKAVLNMAGRVKREKPDDPEDQLLIGVMRDSTLPKLLDEDVPLFEGILTDLFPSIEMAEDDHAGVRVAARSGAKELSLEVVPEQIENVLQLMLTLNSRHGVMLVGPTGGGKTCVYQILAKALAILHDQQPDKEIYAPVDRFLLNPKSIHIDLLYGVLDEVTTSWVDGIVSMIVRRVIAADEAEEDDDDDDGSVSEEEVVGPKLDSSGNPVISPRTYKWVIFDGPVDALWVENMNTVLDDSKMLCLPNGERIKLNDKLRMLFEVENLEEASPATVSRCGMVYVDAWTVGWKPYLAKWLKSPKLTQLLDDPSHHQRLAELAERYVGPVVEFTLENASSCHIAPVPYNLIAAFCNFFEATLLDVFDYEEKMAAKLEASKAELAAVVKAEEREGEASAHVPFDDDDLEYTALTAKELLALLDLVFVFAIVWGAGGVLKGVQRDSFDGLIRDLVSGEIMLPRGASIFDYVVSPEMRALIPWSEAVDDFSFDPNQPFFDIVVPTVDTVAYSHILERSVAVGIPVLLVGPSGVGKSVVALQMIRKLLEDGEVTSIYIPFSAQTSTGRTQSFIESKMDRREKGVMRGPSGKKVVLFVDNVNLPVPEKYKAQPPIELLRQILDSGGLYDRKKLQWVNIEGLSMISACCPPGGGSMNMTARFTRHLFMVSVPKPSDDTLFNMFKQIADGFFVNFAPEVARLTRVMVQGAISMYRQVEEEMNPTPSRVHYTFNLRDLARVFQGLLAADRFVIQHSKDLIHLWIHECTRVFHDRLNSARDRFAFYEIMSQTTQRYFDLSVSVADLVDSPRLFSRLLRTGGNDAPVYAPMMDNTKVVNALHDFMDDYNMESVSKRLDLVFFEGCVEHVVRLTRVLNQRRGSALLVGMAGTGKRSITRLAAFVAGCKLATIKVSRQYGIVEFREDLKGMFFDAGLRNQSIVLLISDEQIVHSSFWEDVNGFLGCGEIPNLWEADEYERIIGECRPLAADAGIPDRRDRIYDWFVSRVRDNVHLVLTMSPNADSFSERIRMFPALVSCCTIDWHFSWPRNALLDVAEHFMRDIDLSGASETGDVSAALTSATVDVHESVIEVADRFFSELGRKVYVTPSSYLSFLQCFGKNLQGLRGKYGTRRDRLRNGLRKLHESQKLVEEMQRDLSDMQPELKVRAEETDTLLAQVDRDTKVANEMKGRVTAEAQRLEMRTEDIRAEQLAAQQELASAMPALEAAVVAVNSLNKASIAEMKAFNRPPDRVKMVMDGVDILLNETPDWEHSKKVLGDPAFLRRLVDYDKENVDENVMRRLRRHIQANDDFNPADVGQVSVAAKTLCVWVLAISEYDEVYRQVKPKQYRVQHMTEALKRAQEDLAKQGETLAGIQKRLDELKAKFNASLREKSSLKKKIDQTNVRLRRASKLIKALGAEQTRWEEQEQEAASALESVVAAAFLTSASTAYLGPFNDMYRTELYTLWVDMVAGMGLNIPPDQSLVAIMGDPLTIRDWNIKGLPKDKVSTTNAILAQNGLQWPLLIDPQGQANKWVKNMEAENGLTVVRMSDPHMLRALESGIRVGSPVLIEEVPASLDPVLDPVLLKQTFMQGNRTMIRVGDSDVNYDPNFRLYLTSKESNPNLLAETFIKLLVINFAVTPAGLEDRLLRNVVRCERPELEEERDNLIVQMSGDEKTLRDLEEKMLHLMYQSEGNILDDESLIETLNTSKVTSDDIKLRVQQSEETEKEIENAREFYRPVAHRGSILYFVVSELAHVETMYQFSLSYFSSLYEKTIETTAKSENVGRRVADLIDSMATVVFDSVARALFTKDRLVFALMITLLIIHDLGAVDAASIAYLMRPAVPEPRSDPEVIAYSDDLSSWCSELQWFTLMDVCYRLGSVFTVKGVNSLDKLLRENLDELEAFSKSPTPWAHPLPLQIAAAGPDGPEVWGNDALMIGLVERLILTRIFQPDRVVSMSTEVVNMVMGESFTSGIPFDIEAAFEGASMTTPVLFVLGKRADPNSALHQFFAKSGMEGRVHFLSLGRGQGAIAENFIARARKSGDWVFLQNCDLALSWMPTCAHLVEKINDDAVVTGVASEDSEVVEEEAEEEYDDEEEDVEGVNATTGGRIKTHPNFRLILSSDPTPAFPASLLQNSVKITMEPPKGLKTNILRVFQGHTDETLVESSELRSIRENDLIIAREKQIQREKAAARQGKDVEDEEATSVTSLLPPPVVGMNVREPMVYRRLVLALGFFHGTLLERGGFGALAWNLGNDYLESDFDAASKILSLLLNESPTEEVAWGALEYMLGVIVYGGRADNPRQLACLNALLVDYVRPESLQEEGSWFPRSHGVYGIPADVSVDGIRQYVDELPQVEDASALGLHNNSILAARREAGSQLIFSLNRMEPAHLKMSRVRPTLKAKKEDEEESELSEKMRLLLKERDVGVSRSPDEETVLSMTKRLQKQLPSRLRMENATTSLFERDDKERLHPLTTILKQEVDNYNRLLAVVKHSFQQLIASIMGLVTVDAVLAQMFKEVLLNIVPSSWAPHAYISRKPLSSWVADLGHRFEFIGNWIEHGHHKSFWIGGLFEPSSFLTGVLQATLSFLWHCH